MKRVLITANVQLDLASTLTNQVIWYTISATGRKVKSFNLLPVEINKKNWQVYKLGDNYSLGFPTIKGVKRIAVKVTSAHCGKRAAES